MTSNLSRWLGGLILGGCAASTPICTVNTHAAPPPTAAQANTAFALDLYAGIRASAGNVFFSPYSVSTCLAMTYAGARGETESQMARVLHFSGPAAQTQAAFGELQRAITHNAAKAGLQLRSANGLWAQAGHPFRPEFLSTTRKDYQARLEQADFKTEGEAARQSINQWVAKQTEDKIRDLLPGGSVNAMTRMVLANAVYFKGLWAKPYEKDQTATLPFFLTGGGQAPAPLMHHVDEVPYFEDDLFQAVDLPYQGGQFALTVLLPRDKNGCSRLESQITPDLIHRSVAQMRKQRVEIFLPRFKLEYQTELKAALTRLGMPDAFSPSSDFSGMDGTHGLYISGVFHKAWVEVNEAGTEAAAATGVVMAMRAARPIAHPPVFRADHPFVFFIREVPSGSILFLGRLANPAG